MEVIMCYLVKVMNISARGDRRGWSNCGIMKSRGKLKNVAENIAPVPLCPLQISNEVT
jgi:hypothetical protein